MSLEAPPGLPSSKRLAGSGQRGLHYDWSSCVGRGTAVFSRSCVPAWERKEGLQAG